MIPVAVGARTATAVGGIAEWGLVHRLTRGRLWILLIGVLLVGIVAVNVLSLSFSASASRMASQSDAIERDISALRAKLAMDVTSNQVEATAQQLGFVVPPPGQIRYVDPSTDDVATAAARLRAGELTKP